MKRQEPKEINWQAVISDHPLESHNPEEWMRYGIALLQTLKQEEDVAKHLQQTALAFLQAQKEGATAKQVAEAQRKSAHQCLRQALMSAKIIWEDSRRKE